MNKLSDEHDSLMVSGSKVSPSVGTAKRSRSEPIPKSSFKADYVRGQEFISSRNASYGNPPMSQADFGSSGHRPTSRTTSSVESIHMPVYYQQQSSSFHSGYSDTRFNSSLGCQLGGSSSQILSESQHLGSSSSSSYEAFLSGNTSGGRSPGQHPSNYFESQQRSNNNEEEEEEEEDEIISHIRKHAPASDF